MASKGVRAAEARAQIDLNRLCETDPVPPTLNLYAHPYPNPS